jgi:hypothetical protein
MDKAHYIIGRPVHGYYPHMKYAQKPSSFHYAFHSFGPLLGGELYTV